MTEVVPNLDRSINVIGQKDGEYRLERGGAIVILGDMGVANQGLQHQVQRYFPNLVVELCARLPDTIEQVGAILIQDAISDDLEAVVAECRTRFPDTPIGVMVNGDWRQVPGLDQLVARHLIQGVLPLRMTLNVWLAAVWLIYSGGEYIANPDPHRSASSLYEYPRAVAPPGPANQGAAAFVTERLLSKRETQVLKLMSEGLQNKLIAANMELSEHTVKVHVHNIIRKLKVHNRTQAAAIYHDGAHATLARRAMQMSA
jgi:DNA-binding NarL/FixJ family response regulator